MIFHPRTFAAALATLFAGVLCLLQAQAQMGPLTGVNGPFTRTSRSAAPIAFINGVTTAAAPPGTDVTSNALDSTGANFLVACVSNFGGASGGGVADSKSNMWNPLTRYIDATGAVQCFWSKPTSVGSGHTASNTSTSPTIGFAAFSNVSASPFDSEVGATGISVNPAGGSITPSANGGLVISATGFLSSNPPIATVDSGFTLVNLSIAVSATNWGFGMAYLIQTTAGATNPVWTVDAGNPWSATNNAYKN